MDSGPAELRRWQEAEEICGATLRAFSGDARVHFRGRRVLRGELPLASDAPQLRLDLEQSRDTAMRGVTDGRALRLALSDDALHLKARPAEPLAGTLFDLLEQMRVESLAPARWPGVGHNLRRRFEQWSLHFHHSGLTESAIGLLLYTVAQMAWARLNACRVLEQTEDLIEPTRAGLAPLLGTDLAGLKRQREHQSGFAEHALGIAVAVQGLVHDEQAALKEADSAAEAPPLRALRLLLGFDESEELEQGIGALADPGTRAENDSTYRVFTRRYDRESEAGSLVRPELLRALREQLDQRVRSSGVNVRRLARRLALLLTRPAGMDWRFGMEEGLIDGRRLSQLVASPTERRLFRQEHARSQVDCLVTLLLDCSGSMKNHAPQLAELVDTLGRALDLASTTTEVLGFTTGEWNGGRVARDWMAAGRPLNPGRLNELQYLVYKPADRSWRRSRRDIAALLKPDLFREGVDGEAVDWACARMRAVDANRRILLVVSDGCPMDAATQQANGDGYLDAHLRHVVSAQLARRDIEIHGLGVGLDLSRYYPSSRAIDLAESPGRAVFDDVVELMGGGTHP